jgi:peptide methionine sulfoxide reductase MsrA
VNDEQKRVAEDTIADVEAFVLWPGKVVTEVSPVGAFWEAEPEHQDSQVKLSYSFFVLSIVGFPRGTFHRVSGPNERPPNSVAPLDKSIIR